MKVKFFILIISIFSLFSFSGEKSKIGQDRIIAYYFHTTYRCPTCLKIENLSKKTIEKYFSKELKENIIVFMPVNVELPENRHFINDYQLYTKSLIFSIFKDGKEKMWKNLDKVWLKVRNEKDFENYVKEEMDNFLKGLK